MDMVGVQSSRKVIDKKFKTYILFNEASSI